MRHEMAPALSFCCVHQVDFKEGSEMKTDLSKVASSREFDSLRTTYGADLVQLIGYYGDACGTG